MNSNRRLTGLWITALIGLIVLFLGRALLPGKVLLPLDLVVQMWPPWQQPDTVAAVHNPLISDVVDYIFPIKTYAAGEVSQGTLPLWNPYVLGGYPLTYNTQAGLWYPLSILYTLLPPAAAVNLTILLQMVLGGCFMFAYLRLLGLRRAAAWLGAILFLFNGMMVVWLEWQVVHAAVIWLPLCLYFLERMAQRLEAADKEGVGATRHSPLYTLLSPVSRDAILAGLTFALPWLGGHWNWALYSSLTAVAYCLWRLGGLILSNRRKEMPGWRVSQLIIPAGLALLVGIGLSLIQVLPAFVYLNQGHRGSLAFNESLALGLKNRAVVALIPDFFGSPIKWNWWGPTNYNETAFYSGIFTFFLIISALFLRRDRAARFFTLWGGLGLLWALGTLFYGLLWVLPVFNGLWPSRAITIAMYCGSVLAAMGLDALLGGQFERKFVRWVSIGVLILGIGTIAVYGLIYQPDWLLLRHDLLWFGVMILAATGLFWSYGSGWLAPRPFTAAVLLLVVADLFWFGHAYNTVGDVADMYPETETARFLYADPEPFRITTLPQGVAYPPNTSLYDRIPAISGYEPAILQNWVNYFNAAEGQEAIHFERELMPLQGLNSPLLDAVNLKYVVTISDWYEDQARPGPAQDIVEGWEIIEGMAASLPFTMPDAGLFRLDLPLKIGEGASGRVVVRVFAADGVQEFANAVWEVTEPLDDGWASFYFGAFSSEWGRDFLLAVSFEGQGEVAIGSARDQLAYRTYYLARPQLAHEDGKTRVYINEGYFQRAYVVSQAIAARNPEEALAQVVANQDRLDEVVVLETDGALPEIEHEEAGTAVITDYQPNRLTVSAKMDSPGYLVLADTFYPGWQATVDGKSTPIFRANSVVRAVQLPAGNHEVVFRFRPPDFYLGAAISLVTLLLASLLLGLSILIYRSGGER